MVGEPSECVDESDGYSVAGVGVFGAGLLEFFGDGHGGVVVVGGVLPHFVYGHVQYFVDGGGELVEEVDLGSGKLGHYWCPLSVVISLPLQIRFLRFFARVA